MLKNKMTKLFYPIVGGLTWFSYRKGTEFRTTVTISDKESKSCAFGQINRQIVNTDKGSFVIVNHMLGSKKLFEDFSEDHKYYVYGYGLNIPYLHLYKKIYNHNGSPCNYSRHCEEKPSLFSRFTKYFD